MYYPVRLIIASVSKLFFCVYLHPRNSGRDFTTARDYYDCTKEMRIKWE